MENLKCSSLMIGDWVKLSKGNWSKIVQVGLTDIEMIAESVYLAEPIPLTAKILEKNGFIYKKLKGVGDKEIWRIEDEHYDIDIYEWSDSIWIFRYDYVEMSSPHTQVTMGFVHELQHALKLCGIEKEIVL